MSIGTALMPLMAMLGGGAAVDALVLCVSRRRKTRERTGAQSLPTDPLAYLFVDKPEE